MYIMHHFKGSPDNLSSLPVPCHVFPFMQPSAWYDFFPSEVTFFESDFHSIDAVLHLLSTLTLSPVDVQELSDVISSWSPGLPGSPLRPQAPALEAPSVTSTTASTTLNASPVT